MKITIHPKYYNCETRAEEAGQPFSFEVTGGEPLSSVLKHRIFRVVPTSGDEASVSVKVERWEARGGDSVEVVGFLVRQ